MITDKAEIQHLFNEEFGDLVHKFEVYDLTFEQARSATEPFVAKAGVYVFFQSAAGVIKVGRHFENSRKRALEHIQDDTGGRMKALEGDSSGSVLLFNVKQDKDAHWIAALEDFFEQRLAPSIPSLRRC